MTYKEIQDILIKKIKKDYGKSCKGFCIGCATCRAHMLLSILDEMVDLEGIVDLEDKDYGNNLNR